MSEEFTYTVHYAMRELGCEMVTLAVAPPLQRCTTHNVVLDLDSTMCPRIMNVVAVAGSNALVEASDTVRESWSWRHFITRRETTASASWIYQKAVEWKQYARG